MKRSYILTVIFPVIFGFTTSLNAETLTASFLSGLRREAAQAHPATSAATLRASAAAQDLRAVRLWDDPMVGVSVMSADVEMRRDDGDIQLMAEQPIPRRGLYAANLEKADAMRRAEIENSRSSALEIGAAAARNAIELALADEMIAIQADQLQWLQKTVENARQRALTPGASAIETLRLESELARETQLLESAKRTRESLARTLNLSLGRPLETSWPALKLPASPPPVPVGTAEVARISTSNPKVRAMMETANAANAETKITHRERQPEVSVAVEANLYSGGDYRSSMVGVKMTLPWFNEPSYTARTKAAQIRGQAASLDVETLRREVAANVLAVSNEAANAAAQAHAYSGDVYNRTLEASQSTETAWINSRAGLNELLDARRMLFSIRLEQRRFIAMQQAALEQLHVLVPTRP